MTGALANIEASGAVGILVVIVLVLGVIWLFKHI